MKPVSATSYAPMFRILTAFVALLALACGAGAQSRQKAKVPKLSLTLTVEKTVWRYKEAAPVKVRIENESEGEAKIPSAVYFTADNRSETGGIVTKREGVFWSPVSLRKTYAAGAELCQDDLSPGRVEKFNGTDIVTIFPPKEKLTLKKGEAKEFDFDLAAMCWNHSIGSMYPNRSIFSLAADYRPKTYSVYFEMEFQTGTTKTGNIKVPTLEHLKSNAVEISIELL